MFKYYEENSIRQLKHRKSYRLCKIILQNSFQNIGNNDYETYIEGKSRIDRFTSSMFIINNESTNAID